MDALQGKYIKVRISGFIPKNGSSRKILDGSAASTMGKPVQINGDIPEIEVKPMIAGVGPISIPLHFIAPVHPGGAGEEVIVIGGDHSGRQGVVSDTTGALWEVILTDQPQGVTIRVTTPPKHLVKIVKQAIRSRIPYA